MPCAAMRERREKALTKTEACAMQQSDHALSGGKLQKGAGCV